MNMAVTQSGSPSSPASTGIAMVTPTIDHFQFDTD
jgi:hypothetical protein